MGDSKQPRLLARQMALGFGAVALVAIATGALLLVIVNDVSGLVAGMQHDETSIRQGTELATAVRDLSLGAATVVVERSPRASAAYDSKRDDVRRRIQALSAHVPTEEHWRIEALAERTQRLHDVLSSTKDGEPSVAHREVRAAGARAAEQADALARATATKMAHAHDLATDQTRLGLVGGGLAALLIVALSVGFTMRLRRQLLRPLDVLTAAARRFGAGDFDHRVGPVGQGELAAVGHAFDSMAEELKRREAERLQSARMAAIGQLAAGVAHELNNPIGIIRGYLETMSPDQDKAMLKEELAILDEEARHCQRIAEDLLSYARMESLDREPIEVGPWLRETAARFSEGHGGRPVVVDVEDAVVAADSTRLHQVVLNLLANATQASKPTDEVRLIGRPTSVEYRIVVEDDGPGVDLADRSRIFEPFFTKRRGGTGLGLAVCLGIVEAHGGTIEVEDSADGGARFVVVLPGKEEAAA